MLIGEWQTVVLDYDKTAEYSGQDIDTTSDLFDLGSGLLGQAGLYDGIQIIVPTIDTGTLSLLVAQTPVITEVPIPLHIDKGDGTTVLWTLSSGTGALMVTVYGVGAVQYGRLKTGGNQSANRTFKVRGIRS